MKNVWIFAITLLFSIPAHGEITNFGEVNDNIFRGGFLKGGASDFLELQELGVESIINLDFLHKDSARLCEEFAMQCQHFPIVLLPWLDKVVDLRPLMKAFREVVSQVQEGQRVYIHCIQGSDRTGALASAVMIREKVCLNPDYDRQQLQQEIISELEKHKFNKRWFPNLFNKILNWTQNTPAWICAQ